MEVKFKKKEPLALKTQLNAVRVHVSGRTIEFPDTALPHGA